MKKISLISLKQELKNKVLEEEEMAKLTGGYSNYRCPWCGSIISGNEIEFRCVMSDSSGNVIISAKRNAMTREIAEAKFLAAYKNHLPTGGNVGCVSISDPYSSEYSYS